MIIGRTKSGKVVDFCEQALREFSREELLDAYSLYRHLATSELKRSGGNAFYRTLEEMADLVRDELTERGNCWEFFRWEYDQQAVDERARSLLSQSNLLKN